jgi:hypothetical protein
VVLTIPRYLNFQQFDQIKVALDQILRTFIKSVEIKVSPDQIGGAYCSMALTVLLCLLFHAS